MKYSFLLFSLFFSILGYAQPPEKSAFPLTNWVSKNSSEDVTIKNETGAPFDVVVTVINNTTSDAPGANIKNCGSTTHLKAGSSVVCKVIDADHPVIISSDSNEFATGTYQIKPK